MVVGVLVFVGVAVADEVILGVGVREAVILGVGVTVFVGVFVGVRVGVDVGDSVGVGVKSPKQSTQFSHGPLNTVTICASGVSSKLVRVQQPMFVAPANNS